jgi:hypothetical protein
MHFDYPIKRIQSVKMVFPKESTYECLSIYDNFLYLMFISLLILMSFMKFSSFTRVLGCK